MGRLRVLQAGAVGVVLGAVGLGGITVSQASQPPTNQPVTVTNTATQPVPTVAQGVTNVTGAVGVSNFPSNQTVSGTVDAAQSGLWNVGISGTPTVAVGSLPSLPAGSNAIGSVSVSNFPTPSSGARSLTHGLIFSMDANTHQATPFVDTSAVRAIRVLVGCAPIGATPGNCSQATFDLKSDLVDTAGNLPFFLDEQSLGSTMFKVYDLPGLAISLQFTNNSTGTIQISWAVAGWAT